MGTSWQGDLFSLASVGQGKKLSLEFHVHMKDTFQSSGFQGTGHPWALEIHMVGSFCDSNTHIPFSLSLRISSQYHSLSVCAITEHTYSHFILEMPYFCGISF